LTFRRRAFDGTVPPHFYGEMSKTELGCQVLQEKGHFTEFTQFIKQHGLESEDTDLIMKLKSILWTVVRLNQRSMPFHLRELLGQRWCDGGWTSVP
jgi:rapamycin-insensitive companion of mTOR